MCLVRDLWVFVLESFGDYERMEAIRRLLGFPGLPDRNQECLCAAASSRTLRILDSWTLGDLGWVEKH